MPEIRNLAQQLEETAACHFGKYLIREQREHNDRVFGDVIRNLFTT